MWVLNIWTKHESWCRSSRWEPEQISSSSALCLKDHKAASLLPHCNAYETLFSDSRDNSVRAVIWQFSRRRVGRDETVILPNDGLCDEFKIPHETSRQIRCFFHSITNYTTMKTTIMRDLFSLLLSVRARVEEDDEKNCDKKFSVQLSLPTKSEIEIWIFPSVQQPHK